MHLNNKTNNLKEETLIVIERGVMGKSGKCWFKKKNFVILLHQSFVLY